MRGSSPIGANLRCHPGRARSARAGTQVSQRLRPITSAGMHRSRIGSLRSPSGMTTRYLSAYGVEPAHDELDLAPLYYLTSWIRLMSARVLGAILVPYRLHGVLERLLVVDLDDVDARFLDLPDGFFLHLVPELALLELRLPARASGSKTWSASGRVPQIFFEKTRISGIMR